MKSRIKIACICNMNNMMFILCRYLRDAGYDAHLFVLSDEPKHFHPSADSYDVEYITYYHQLSQTKSTIYKKDFALELRRELGDFDFLIGSDIAPALIAIIGRKLDIFIPHGSDIYALPFQQSRPKDTDAVWWQREVGMLSQLQELGIREINTILFPDEYDIHFPFKTKLKTSATYHNTSGPMVYIHQYTDLEGKALTFNLKHATVFQNIRKESSLMLFSHSRHNGFNLTGKMAVHDKGNDQLIRGFAEFLRLNDLDARLVLFDYGINVEASKNLIQELSIEKHIHWMPLMDRKEIMFGLMLSDIACGQFKNSWLTCGVVNESLATNKPLLHYRDDALYNSDYQWLYPVLNANSPAAISNLLSDYLNNKTNYDNASNKGSDWLYEHTVKGPLSIIEGVINSKDNDDLFLSTSTLNEIHRRLRKYRLLDKIYRAQGKVRESLKRN